MQQISEDAKKQLEDVVDINMTPIYEESESTILITENFIQKLKEKDPLKLADPAVDAVLRVMDSSDESMTSPQIAKETGLQNA